MLRTDLLTFRVAAAVFGIHTHAAGAIHRLSVYFDNPVMALPFSRFLVILYSFPRVESLGSLILVLLVYSRGFTSVWAPSKLIGCEGEFGHLV